MSLKGPDPKGVEIHSPCMDERMRSSAPTALYKRYVEIVEKALYAFLARVQGPRDYYDYLLYHFGFKGLNGGFPGNGTGRLLGKRLRPVMSLFIYQAVTGKFQPVLPLVVGAEIMHNASLVHDDIQDHDELRWGRPTLWKILGTEQGINCGDTLQALAYGSILELSQNGFKESMILQILAASNRIHVAVVEGQFMDLEFEKRLDISLAEYFEMIGKKTATPYAGIAECAATLATDGGNPGLVSAYRDFAQKFGMLFQLTDDMLGIWGDVQRTGKIPADIRNKKKTLPVIYALNHAEEKTRRRLAALYEKREKIEQEAPAVLRILEEAGAREFCLEWILKLYRETLEALGETGILNLFQEELQAMADYCYRRSQVQ